MFKPPVIHTLHHGTQTAYVQWLYAKFKSNMPHAVLAATAFAHDFSFNRLTQSIRATSKLDLNCERCHTRSKHNDVESRNRDHTRGLPSAPGRSGVGGVEKRRWSVSIQPWERRINSDNPHLSSLMRGATLLVINVSRRARLGILRFIHQTHKIAHLWRKHF